MNHLYPTHKEPDTEEILLESYDIKPHKTLKNSIPSYFLQSDTSEHLCRLKLDELIKQNEQLKTKIYQIEYQNQLLTQKNRQLEADIRQLVTEISEQPAKTPSFTKIKLYTYGDEDEKQSKGDGRLQNMKNLRKMVDSLNCENKLLLQMKELYEKKMHEISVKNTELQKKMKQMQSKMKEMQQKMKEIQRKYLKQREDNIQKSQKLQQEYIYNKQNERNIDKLQKMLKDANQEMNYLSYQTKLKEDQIRDQHHKFHKELDRMKEKVEKYKGKAQSYRVQRDQLSLEIQKAKVELGAVTLRKYFPDDIDV